MDGHPKRSIAKLYAPPQHLLRARTSPRNGARRIGGCEALRQSQWRSLRAGCLAADCNWLQTEKERAIPLNRLPSSICSSEILESPISIVDEQIFSNPYFQIGNSKIYGFLNFADPNPSPLDFVSQACNQDQYAVPVRSAISPHSPFPVSSAAHRGCYEPCTDLDRA